MAVDQGRLMAVLYPHVSSPETADRLFARAAEVDPNVISRVALSDAVAESAYKGKLGKAVRVASDTRTAPSILAKFAKDARVAVRTALAGNPSLPYDSVVQLSEWGATRQDSLVLTRVLPRLSAEDLTACISRHVSDFRSHSLGWNHLFSQTPPLSATLLKRPDLALEVARQGIGAINMELARATYHQAPQGLSLTTLVKQMEPEQGDKIVQALLWEVPVLSRELAELAPTKLPVQCHNVAAVEQGALLPLARASASGLKAALDLGLAEQEVRGVLSTPSCTMDHLAAVLDAMSEQRSFSAAFERFFVEQVLESWGPHVPQRFEGILGHLKHRLPSRLTEELLRRMPYHVMNMWLVAQGINAPSPGQLTRLVKNPGEILRNPAPRVRVLHYARSAPVSTSEWMTHEELLGRIMATACSHTTAPGVAGELVQLLDGLLVQQMASSHVAALVAPAAEAAFGSSPDAWDMFVVLASDWSGSLSELIGACTALTGQTPTEASPAPQEQPRYTECEALTLV